MLSVPPLAAVPHSWVSAQLAWGSYESAVGAELRKKLEYKL